MSKAVMLSIRPKWVEKIAYCSECAETSRDAHENYCPNCGTIMDGGDNNAAD